MAIQEFVRRKVISRDRYLQLFSGNEKEKGESDSGVAPHRFSTIQDRVGISAPQSFKIELI
jgi:hypothetical protein